jgi:hypothetical protein
MISIVTCVLNDTEDLLRTRNSIVPILSEDIQWVLKFSQHVSTEFINSIEGNFISMIQVPDASLYEGLNQAISYVKSPYYFVLGAGDIVLTEALRELLSTVKNNKQDVCAYFTPVFLEDNSIFQTVPNEINSRMSCPHPGAILQTIKSIDIGGYDTSYKIASDYDHLSRYIQAFGMGKVLDLKCSVHASGGLSYTRQLEGMIECELIKKRVWKYSDLRTHANLLKISTDFSINLILQVEKLNSK